jgi:hypothetical protein
VKVAALTGDYERIRERVHAGKGALWPLGWGVLAARGLAAWLRVRTLEPGTVPGAGLAPVTGPGPELEPGTAALVRVLADIALARLARPPG